jgi:hypothetical protein
MIEYLSDEIDDVAEFNEAVGSASDEDDSEPRNGRNPENTPRKLDSADFASWGVLGNDHYVACSKTVKELPSGIYRVAMNNRGEIVFMKQRVITDNLFRLADSVSIKVLESIEKFWNSKANFDRYGMIFKRGIMLFGPAGSGKTVTVTLLAQQIIDRGGIVVMCERPDHTSSALQTVRRIESSRPIVNIIEDIDTVIENWGEQAILPMLDGENQVANIVHVATTNYPERLDSRITNRPSRFDEIRKVDMPVPEVRREYIKSVLENKDKIDDKTLERWVEDTAGMSLAHLRELVVAVKCLERDYEPTIARLKKMQTSKPKSSGGNGAGFKAKKTPPPLAEGGPDCDDEDDCF